ncbi:transcriptional regulator NanR [Psychromarinibacter sp. C21-152]|uniref:Transcriptional regulator NanR n=2 Tax=Psychromarinibacter sediminicola TaxID=3033385 RepID=A0AAE3NPX1_9RHOB|nr:transcriptional regulator NanR [Psychromarinibacter sediminicola]
MKRRKLSDDVRLRLEEMIRDEIYPEGSHLPSERDLMELFDVGRPSIREALFSLERMGLVRIHTGERPRVTRPTMRDMMSALAGTANLLLDQPSGVEHFEQAREFLEVSVAHHAARHATPDQIAALEAALEDNERAIPRARAFAITDVAFHRVLTEIPGNPIFVAMHEAIVDWMINRRTLPSAAEQGNRQSFAGHQRIVDAIRRREPEAAADAMRDHLEHAQRRFNQKRTTQQEETT